MSDIATPPTPDLAELAGRLADMLELLGQIEPLAGAVAAAVDARGFPGNVAAGELIESAWGNATATTLKTLVTIAGIAGVGGALAGSNQTFIRSAAITAPGLVLAVARVGVSVTAAPMSLIVELKNATTPGGVITAAGQTPQTGNFALPVSSGIVVNTGDLIEVAARVTAGAGNVDPNLTRLDMVFCKTPAP